MGAFYFQGISRSFMSAAIGPFSSDRFARDVKQAVAVIFVLLTSRLDFGRDTVGERFR